MNDYAFIFDMDGVIVDSNPYHKIALKQFCTKYGRPLTEEALHKKIYGRTNKEWITALFGPLPADELTRYAAEKEALYRDLYANDIRPVAGLLNFLERLKAEGIPRAIGTSAPRSNVDFTLSATNITKYFSVILDESYVKHGKPDPEIYLKVAAALAFPPDQCIVFEDSLSGVQAGKEAGCKVVGITTTHRADELTEADWVVDDFQELTPWALIKRLFGEGKKGCSTSRLGNGKSIGDGHDLQGGSDF
jgi:beta-phosphoglucomutase